MTVRARLCAGVLAAILLLIGLAGCGGNYLQFTDERLVNCMLRPSTDPNQTIEITLYNDGRGVYRMASRQPYQDEEIAAEETFTLSDTEITSLQAEIARTNFMKLRQDLTPSHVTDSSLAYITVYANGKIHTCGGSHPTNKRFVRLRNDLLSCVPDDTVQACRVKFASAIGAESSVSDSDK